MAYFAYTNILQRQNTQQHRDTDTIPGCNIQISDSGSKSYVTPFNPITVIFLHKSACSESAWLWNQQSRYKYGTGMSCVAWVDFIRAFTFIWAFIVYHCKYECQDDIVSWYYLYLFRRIENVWHHSSPFTTSIFVRWVTKYQNITILLLYIQRLHAVKAVCTFQIEALGCLQSEEWYVWTVGEMSLHLSRTLCI